MSGVLGGVLATLSGVERGRVSDQLLFDKVIGFRGIVEGVGASTLVQNVAIALADQTAFNICVIDTHMLYPCQHLLLRADKKDKDIFDFAGGLSTIISQSNLRSNLYTIGFKERTLVDMMSTKDIPGLADDLIQECKTFFDIVLVDVSHEPTNFSVAMMRKCNKIITVADSSFKCISNLSKSMEYVLTLGVPLAKLSMTVLNKNISTLNSGALSALKALGLNVVAVVPFAQDIAELGVLARSGYNKKNSSSLHDFNVALQILVRALCAQTDVLQQYYNIQTKAFVEEDIEIIELAVVGEDNTVVVHQQQVVVPEYEVTKSYADVMRIGEVLLSEEDDNGGGILAPGAVVGTKKKSRLWGKGKQEAKQVEQRVQDEAALVTSSLERSLLDEPEDLSSLYGFSLSDDISAEEGDK